MEEAADILTRQYESITFEQVYRDMLHLVPPPPCRVLDIGAGSGRDAAALARQGYGVTAVEPTDALRAAGERLHAGLGITWMDDALPELGAVRAMANGFGLILLTAVWMHLDGPERAQAMGHLGSLTSPAGRVLLSLRHGPVPEGRRMFDVSADETSELGRRHGFQEIARCQREDMLERSDVHWTFLCLQRV
jgi:SAM-dependent methyltransferase